MTLILDLVVVGSLYAKIDQILRLPFKGAQAALLTAVNTDTDHSYELLCGFRPTFDVPLKFNNLK